MTGRHDLDEAIDLVAKRMTGVTQDDGFVDRIVADLPQRSMWSNAWVARFAIGALATLAVAVGIVRTDVRTIVQTGVQTGVQTDVQADVQTGVQADVQTGVQTGVQADVQAEVQTDVQTNDFLNARPDDHAFALVALSIDSLAATPVPAEEPLVVTPLEIADLPLTNDFSR